MDNLTHTLIGATMANAGLKQRFGRGTTWALVISSNFCDIDVFWRYFSDLESHFYRRMLTHSVVGIPILAAILAGVLKLFFKDQSWKKLYGLCLLGMVVHVFFDLANSYGVVPFYPLSRVRLELAWLFIIDLFIWAVLLLPLLLCWIKSRWTGLQLLSRISGTVLSFYVLFCAGMRLHSIQVLDRWEKEKYPNATFSYVFPEALGPHRWRGIIREGDTYSAHMIYPLTGRVEDVASANTDDRDPDVERIYQTREGGHIRRFFKAPLWQKEADKEGRTIWKVSDLRFSSVVINRRNPFAYGFLISDGAITYLGRVD